jgi:hypothetical protein
MANEYTTGQKIEFLGAALSGQVPQFQQQMEQLDEKRMEAMYKDAGAAYQLLGNNDYQGIINLANDRLGLLQRLPGSDPSDTMQVLQLAQGAAAGNTQSLSQLTQVLESANQQGLARGYYAAPAPRERVVLGENEDMYEVQADGSLKRIGSGSPKSQTPLTEVGKINEEYNRGNITLEERNILLNAQAENAGRESEEAKQMRSLVISESNQVYDIALRLLASDLDPIAGWFDQGTGNWSGESIQKQADVEALGDLLTLNNMERMTGVLSESDIDILRKAATGGLDLRAGSPQFKNSLRRIVGAISNSAKVKGFDLSPVEYDRDYYSAVSERVSIPINNQGLFAPRTDEEYAMIFIGEKYVDPDDGKLYVKK